MSRMANAGSVEGGRAEGIKIAQEMLAEARTLGHMMVQGVQVSAPFGKYRAAADVLASEKIAKWQRLKKSSPPSNP